MPRPRKARIGISLNMSTSQYGQGGERFSLESENARVGNAEISNEDPSQKRLFLILYHKAKLKPRGLSGAWKVDIERQFK